MKDLKVKQDVLQEIIDLMDEREGDSLKKHPKLLASKVEVEAPAPEADEKSEELPKEESAELPEGEISPEDLDKLLEHLKSKELE